MEVVIFGIKLTLNPIAFTIPIGKNGWDVYWYGIIIAFGFSLALVYGYFNSKRFNINNDKLLDVIIFTVPVAILCARAYYVIFDGQKLNSFKDFFGFDSSGFSGLAIYGGVIGAVGMGGLMCYIKKIKIFDGFDLASIGFLIGQGIGRWGNFMNQEAFGTPTGSDWFGMMSKNTGYQMVHPCFLYESIWCLLGVLVLHLISKKRRFSGEIALYYCIWYGIERGFLELIRTDSLTLGPIRVSSLLSFVICIGAIIVLWYKYKQLKAVPAENYEKQFEAQSEIEEETENEQAD